VTDSVSSEHARKRRRRRLIVIVLILLPLAVHAVWDQVESTLLARAIADLRGRGEPVNVAARRAALPTPEQRHAAALYAAAADLVRHLARDDGYRMTRKDVESPATDPRSDAAGLQAYFSRAQPALDLLASATPLEFNGFGSIAPELHENQSSLEGLSAANSLHADILSAGGEGDRAADLLVRSARLQRTLTIVFYRSLARSRLFGSLRILLGQASPSEAALQRLQAAIETWPDDDGLYVELQEKRAELLGTFWPHPADGSWALRPQQGFRGGAGQAIAFVAVRPVLTHAMRRQFGPYEEALAVAREPWPVKLDSARALAQKYHVDPTRPASSRGLVRQIADPSFGVWQLTYALPFAGANLAMRRTSMAALAVERFRRAHAGQAPPSLDVLVPAYLAAVPIDPFDGKPLKYRQDADSYVIYSVDRDRADDGGALYGHGTGVAGRAPERRDLGIRVRLVPKTLTSRRTV
jgi:hypothetical protein